VGSEAKATATQSSRWLAVRQAGTQLVGPVLEADELEQFLGAGDDIRLPAHSFVGVTDNPPGTVPGPQIGPGRDVLEDRHALEQRILLEHPGDAEMSPAMRWVPVMVRPLKAMVPPETLRVPSMRLSTVLLPAPLGPMSPMISPSSTDTLTLLTAANPPKCRERSLTSRIAMTVNASPGLSPAAMPVAPAVGGAVLSSVRILRARRQPVNCRGSPTSPMGMKIITMMAMPPMIIGWYCSRRRVFLGEEGEDGRTEQRPREIILASHYHVDQEVDGQW